MDSGTFTLMYILTIVGILLIMTTPVIITTVIVLYIRKRNAEQNKQLQNQAMERAKEKERLVHEELDLKKMKYKRVRCRYCDSLNAYEELECSGCGASLEGAKEIIYKQTGKL